MEQELNKILNEAELNLAVYKKEIDTLDRKIEFLTEHNFNKEAEWLKHEKDSKRDIFIDYHDKIISIRNIMKK